jgi:DNA-binding MarR family transcriptional regulator
MSHEFLDADEWQAWNALLMINRTVLQALDTALRSRHGIGVTEFDVLITLFNAPQRRLRMTALAGQVLLSPAGTTHLVTRLERDGLLRRDADPSDGRKWFTVLTDKGAETLRAARQTHNAIVRESFTANTTPAERRTMQRLWRRLAAPEGD